MKRIQFFIISLFAIFACSNMAMAAKAGDSNTIQGPWMTGPLLAPAGATIPKGHTNIEPYLFFTDNKGTYNDRWKSNKSPEANTLSPTMIISQGLTNWMDIQLVVPFDYKSKEGQHSTGFGDSSVTLGFQALRGQLDNWVPDLRLTVEETFPIGDYKNLNPARLGTDAIGAGSYQTSLGANFQKLTEFNNGKFLRTRLSLIYTFPGSTNVTGFNTYGGNASTNGWVEPGQVFNSDLSFEYTLTQHWVPAIDFAYQTSQASVFHGFTGRTSSGLPVAVGGPSSNLFSIAPAIEYNFSPNLGIIAGVWFSATGRNTGNFTSGVIAINFYH